MIAAVVALGKIGLPLAVQFARSGVRTIGVDIASDVVAAVRRAEAPFPGEANLDEYLGGVIESGMLTATTDTAEAVSAADVVVVVVPLVVDGSGVPDFGAIDSATAAIGRGLKAGQTVVYETTVPVGTTRARFAPALQSQSGLCAGVDFHLAFSPERVFSGRIFSDLRRYPKLVGGIDDASGKAAVAFYERVLQFDHRNDLDRPNGVWQLGSAEAAEFAKLAETTYRDVNIALANEFATYAESLGLDVREVISAANSQPFSHVHRPGIAVGGHCIPVYPRFYLSGDPTALIPRAARAVNEQQPARLVARLESQAGSLEGAKVAVLGAAYRGGVKETAFSGVFPVTEALIQRGALPLVHDPLFEDAELTALGLNPFHAGDSCDFAVVQADHVEYRSFGPEDLAGVKAIVDGRGIIDAKAWAASAVAVLAIGSA